MFGRYMLVMRVAHSSSSASAGVKLQCALWIASSSDVIITVLYPVLSSGQLCYGLCGFACARFWLRGCARIACPRCILRGCWR